MFDNTRKIKLLSEITIANGATPHEEAAAKQKIAELSKAPPSRPIVVEDVIPPGELEFRQKWAYVKMENRKKWGIK